MSDVHRQFEVHAEALDGNANDRPDMVTWSAALPYVPGLVLDAIRREPHRHGPWIERIEGSIALADISGFTPMAEQLAQAGKEGAEWLTDIINRYFGRMLHIARGHGCCNTRFAGDALMLTFMGTDHAARAITVASAMQRATSRFTTFRAGEHQVRLKMTVGVHSGLFWSAVAGLPELRMQHFILGREASRVAEVQGSATAGQLRITGAIFDQVGELCMTKPCVNGYRVLSLSKPIVPQKRVKEEAPPACSPLDLLAYVPPPIAMAMRSGRQVRTIAGEHRKVTIAFINCLGVSELLEQQGAYALLDELQRYLSSVLQLSHQYGGFLMDNDIHKDGFKLILVFGAPVAHEQDSANALRFALELGQELAKLNLHFSHRIGINSGFVFSADVGAPYARQYTVMGDAVNLAARLMSSGAVNQILVSSRVMAEAGPVFVAEELAPIRVKGKKDPVRVCLLKRERSMIPATTTEPSSPLVGRQAEVESFQRVCCDVENGSGRAIVISGSAGIGKSRLIAEFRNLLHSGGWAIHEGMCYSHTAGKPFAAWIQILNAFFDITDAETPEGRTQKVMSAVKDFGPHLLEIACLLDPLLGLSIPQNDIVRSLDDENRRRRLFELITGLIQAKAVQAPLALILEDLHYADSSSLQLINHVSTNLRSSRLLLCLTHRPKKDLQLNLPLASTVLMPLSELPQPEALHLVGLILNRTELPSQVQEAILTKARGNPLFLEQVSASIRHSGVLDRILGAASFRVTQEMASLDIPDQIHTLIMSRIDILNDAAKEVLRTAAVIGNTFELPVLQDVLDREQRIGLRGRLHDLVQLDLAVREKGVEHPTYRFKHALIQEVAYDSLPFAQRRKLHHQVGAYIEETNAGQLETQYEILVHHFDKAKDKGKTLEYSSKSGDKAKRIFANQEAIAYYQKALEVATELPDTESMQISLEEGLGDIHDLTGQYDQALARYEAGQQWCEALRVKSRFHSEGETPPPSQNVSPDVSRAEDLDRHIAVLCDKKARVYERKGRYDTALEWLDKGWGMLSYDCEEKARLCTDRAAVLYRQAAYAQASYWSQQGLDIAHNVGDLGRVAHACDLLGMINNDLGNTAEAIRYLQQSLSIYEQLHDMLGQAGVLGNLGISLYLQSNWEEARKHYQRSLETWERIGDVNGIAMVSNNLGEILSDQGRLDEALQPFQRSLELWGGAGYSMGVGVCHLNLGRLYTRAGDCEEALSHLKQGLQIFEQIQSKGFVSECCQGVAEAYLGLGKPQAALEHCERSLSLAIELKMTLLEGVTRRLMGQVYGLLREWERAEELLRESQRILREVGVMHELGHTLWQLALLYHQEGKGGGRREAAADIEPPLTEAVAIFQKLGIKFDEAKAAELRAGYRTGSN